MMYRNSLFSTAIFLICLIGSVNAIQGEGMSIPAMLMNVKSTSHLMAYGVMHSGIWIGSQWTYDAPQGCALGGYDSHCLDSSSYADRSYLSWACNSFNYSSNSCNLWQGFDACPGNNKYNPRKFTCAGWTNGACVYWVGSDCDMGIAVATEWTCTNWNGVICSQWTGVSSGAMGAPSSVICNAWNGDYCSHFDVVNSGSTGGILTYYCSTGTTELCKAACDGILCSDYCSGSTRYYGGSCQVGSCTYASSQVCDYGCASGSCLSPEHTITLSYYPVDGSSDFINKNISFWFGVTTNGYILNNCSIWSNTTGSWSLTQWNTTEMLPNTILHDNNINASFTNVGTLKYGAACYFNNSIVFSTTNKTLELLGERVILVSPIDGVNASVFNNMPFEFMINEPVTNCSLWSNFSGSWQDTQLNQTALSLGLNTINYSSLTNGSYIWNIGCYFTDGAENFSLSNRTLNVADCGDIYSNIILPKSITSDGSCFSFAKPFITLDCDNYAVIGNGLDSGLSNVGIWNQNNLGVTVKNCEVYNFSRGVVYGIASDTNSPTNGTVLNNTVHGNTFGISLLGGGTGNDTVITKNNVYGVLNNTAPWGIGVYSIQQGGKQGLNISYNIIQNLSAATFGVGAYLFYASGAEYHDNIIMNISGASLSIGVLVASTNSSIVRDNNISKVNDEAILVQGPALDNQFIRNKLSLAGFAGNGMLHLSSLGASTNSNTTIDCGGVNVVGNNSQTGVLVASSGNTTIQNCFVENNTVGLRVISSDLVTANNNTFYNNSVSGVYLSSSNGLVFFNNNVSYNGLPMSGSGGALSLSTLYANYTNNVFQNNYPSGLVFSTIMFSPLYLAFMRENRFINNTIVELDVDSVNLLSSDKDYFQCGGYCITGNGLTNSLFANGVMVGNNGDLVYLSGGSKLNEFNNMSFSNYARAINSQNSYGDYVINSVFGVSGVTTALAQAGSSLFILNSTLNRTNGTASGSGNISIQWHVKACVSDNNSIPLEGANVVVTDALGVSVISLATDASGCWSGFLPVTEIFQNSSELLNVTPHMFNATKLGYNYSSESWAVSQPNNIINLMLRLQTFGNGHPCTNNSNCTSGYCNNGFCCDSGICCDTPHVQDSCPSGNVCTDDYNCTPTLANCQASAFSWLCTSGYASHGFCTSSGWGCGIPGAQSSCDSNWICYSTCYCILRSLACGNTTSSCMVPQPLYCDAYGQIGNNCATCGCPSDQTCRVDGMCYTNSSWYEFWKGVNWDSWKWLLILGALVAFFLGVFAFLKRMVEN